MKRTTPEFESAIYRGRVSHRRFTGATHEFVFPLHMMLLKLDEVPTLLQQFWQLGSGPLRWARFKRSDYLGETTESLSDSVRNKLVELSDRPLTDFDGDVFLLCQLRYLGIYFSPLNLYFLRQEGEFRYLLAEVSNTPWNERHYYCLDIRDPRSHRKEFHVSPFNPMEQTYHWKIIPPDPGKANCSVHIAIDSSGGTQPRRVFDATLSLRRHAMNQKELTRVLLGSPAQTLSILASIHWQALKLLIRKSPVYRHPDKVRAHTEKGRL